MALQNTAYGYPYPPATDPVRDGAAAIQALAGKLRPLGVMLGAQPPAFGANVPDPTQVRLGVFNMDIATNSSGVASFGNPFSTVLLGMWIQQIYKAGEVMAHFTQSGASASTISVLVRNPATAANIPSSYFQVNVLMIGY